MIIKEDLLFSSEGEMLRVTLSGEIDHHSTKRLRERIDGEIYQKRPEGLILDFSKVSFMDSSGIGLIIGRAETCRERGITVRLSGLCDRLKKLIRLSGIDKLTNLTIS